jgi:four helix bundle protein
MTPEEMKKRTKQFALRIIRLIESLPRTPTAGVIGGQLLRAGTSVGSNYRAACCSRSAADFISRMGIVEEEADESAFWIELLVETGIVNERLVAALLQESKEIVAIAVASVKTARGGARQSRASR